MGDCGPRWACYSGECRCSAFYGYANETDDCRARLGSGAAMAAVSCVGGLLFLLLLAQCLSELRRARASGCLQLNTACVTLGLVIASVLGAALWAAVYIVTPVSETLDPAMAATARDLVLEPGQFALFDVYMAHGSRENRSDRRRAGVVFRYMPTTSVFDYELAAQHSEELGRPANTFRQLHLMRGVDRSGRNDFSRNKAT